MPETCEFVWMSEVGVMPCLAPPTFAVRWKQVTGERGGGAMCDMHIRIACEQLMDDDEVIPNTVEVARLA